MKKTLVILAKVFGGIILVMALWFSGIVTAQFYYSPVIEEYETTVNRLTETEMNQQAKIVELTCDNLTLENENSLLSLQVEELQEAFRIISMY